MSENPLLEAVNMHIRAFGLGEDLVLTSMSESEAERLSHLLHKLLLDRVTQQRSTDSFASARTVLQDDLNHARSRIASLNAHVAKLERAAEQQSLKIREVEQQSQVQVETVKRQLKEQTLQYSSLEQKHRQVQVCTSSDLSEGADGGGGTLIVYISNHNRTKIWTISH